MRKFVPMEREGAPGMTDRLVARLEVQGQPGLQSETLSQTQQKKVKSQHGSKDGAELVECLVNT